jgi:hypothetical protein
MTLPTACSLTFNSRDTYLLIGFRAQNAILSLCTTQIIKGTVYHLHTAAALAKFSTMVTEPNSAAAKYMPQVK